MIEIMRLSLLAHLPRCKPPLPFLGLPTLIRGAHYQGDAFPNRQSFGLKVTRNNFQDVLPRLKQQIEEAAFVALDLELTGVMSAPWRRAHVFDTSDTSYYKLKDAAEKFAVLQFGVCAFKWIEAGQKFIAYPYSFHLFPHNELMVNKVQYNFLCQTDSLEFLAKHGFDFNACMYNGISYLSKEQEAVAQSQINQSNGAGFHAYIKQKTWKKFQLNRTDTQYSLRIKYKLDCWLATLSTNRIKLMPLDTTSVNTVTDNSNAGNQLKNIAACSIHGAIQENEPSNGTDNVKFVDDLKFLSEEKGDNWHTMAADVSGCYSGNSLISELPSCVFAKLSNRHAQIVMRVANDYFCDLVPVIVNNLDSPDLSDVHVMFTASTEDRTSLIEELEKNDKEKRSEQLSNAVGFRHVIDAIIASRKVVVGHNCILDFAHIYEKFLRPLPPSITEFAGQLIDAFPCIFDTKYLAKVYPQLKAGGVTALSKIYMKILKNQSRGGKWEVELATEMLKNQTGRDRWDVEIAMELQNKINASLSHIHGFGFGQRGVNTLHEAGFDAYMTGYAFAHILSIINLDPQEIQHLPQSLKSGMKTGLEKHANLLCLGYLSSAVLDLATGETTRKTESDDKLACIVLVWGFPSGFSCSRLESMIRNAGAVTSFSSVRVLPVDESSAFAKFRDPQVVEQFLKLLRNPPNALPEVAALVGTGIRAAKFSAYEELCKSSLTTFWLSESAEALELGVRNQERERESEMCDDSRDQDFQRMEYWPLKQTWLSNTEGILEASCYRQQNAEEDIDTGGSVNAASQEDILGKDDNVNLELDIQWDHVQAGANQ